jgi:hypothetical protein
MSHSTYYASLCNMKDKIEVAWGSVGIDARTLAFSIILRSLASFRLRLFYCKEISSNPFHFGYEAGLRAHSRSGQEGKEKNMGP